LSQIDGLCFDSTILKVESNPLHFQPFPLDLAQPFPKVDKVDKVD